MNVRSFFFETCEFCFLLEPCKFYVTTESSGASLEWDAFIQRRWLHKLTV